MTNDTNLKKVLSKAISLENGKELALAAEFVAMENEIKEIGDTVSAFTESAKQEIDERIKEIEDNIPEPEKGEKGDSYVLTTQDKREIASLIKVPIVDRVIERTEVVKEQPIVTETVREVAKYETRTDIVNKINEGQENDIKIDASQITGLEAFIVSRGQPTNYGSHSNIIQLVAGSNITIDNTNPQYPIISSTGGGGGGTWGSITGTLSDQTDLQTALDAKQDELVSGTSIKTINGASLLGSGNIVIDATVTLADLASNSTDAATSTYTLTNNVDVVFKTAEGSTILTISESTTSVSAATIAGTTVHAQGSLTLGGNYDTISPSSNSGHLDIMSSQPIGIMPSNTMLMFFKNGHVNLGGGAVEAVASSLFEMVSTTQGFLPPRMTTTQRDAISSPAEGLVVYDSTTHKLNYRNNSAWVELAAGSSGLTLETDGVTNGDQTLLNLIAGTNITLTDDGSGGVTIDATGGGGGTWGSITGTLSSQTDLQTALDAKITANAGITGATKTKITYDSKGLVTAGADATTADIADSSNKRYVTDAHLVILGNTSGTNTGDQDLSGYVKTDQTVGQTIGATGARLTKLWATDITVTNAISGSVTGNAGTATALQNARTIGGVSFDGTANITVATATGGFTVSGGNLALGTNSLTMTGSIGATGARVTKGWFTDLEVTNTIVGSINGLAATATALATARNINGVAFDGTGNITVTAAAGTLTGTTLNSSVVTSSLTSVGTIGTGVWQGTAVAMAYGGTGTSLTDPNANTLMGWDDTDGAIKFITIGSNLSYDHATHTLSATGGSGGTLQAGEVPTGTVNGVNTDFTLSYTPDNGGAIIVLLDGVAQYNGSDFTVSGTTISFAVAPASGSTIYAYNGVTGATVTGAAWGEITGTLSDQTDLQTALNLKAPLISPSFTTPTLGVASATSINKVAITAPATAATLTIANNKTFTVNNTITLSGTDSTVMTFPTTTATIARTDAGQTFTGTQVFSSTITGSISGNAGTATALQNARTIGGVSFDGTANITVSTATGGFTVSGGNLAIGANDLTMTGSIAATGSRVTKGWFTNIESTNMPTVGGTSLSSTFSPIASPTFTGTVTLPAVAANGVITLAENSAIALYPAGSADGKYTGITIAATAGYTQAFGDLVYLDPTDSRWEACDANSAAGADGDARGIIGMVVSPGTDGTACIILLQGVIRADAKFPTFTVNNPIYVSETLGLVTQTQPTTTDVVVRIVGTAITADEMYFNPDGLWFTHT